MSDGNGKRPSMTAGIAPSGKILKNKDEIKTYLGNISDYIFRKYIKMGMPARFEDGNWIAFADNIDSFFQKITNVSFSKLVDEIENRDKNQP